MRTIADHVLDIASNSVTAGATQIWLDIDHNPADHLFVFTVRDNGRGMDADIRTRVFDPFFTTRHTASGGLVLDCHSSRKTRS